MERSAYGERHRLFGSCGSQSTDGFVYHSLMACYHYLARRIKVYCGDQPFGAFGHIFTNTHDFRIIETNNSCHGTLVNWHCGLHKFTALAYKIDSVAEVQGGSAYERGKFAQAVTCHY